MKILGYKIIKAEVFEVTERYCALYERVLRDQYWFSQWRFLSPFWEWISGNKDVSSARDEFRELSAQSIGYSLNKIRDMEREISILSERVKYFEGIIKNETNN